MFPVKNRLKLLVVLTVWATIFFTACGTEDNPTSATPLTPVTTEPDHGATPSPMATTPVGAIPAGIPSEGEPPPAEDDFTNTVAVFLLDVSTSIADLCEPEFQEWRAQIPEFIITYAHAYHHNEHGRNDEFKIGWATFPTRSGESLDLNPEGLNAFDDYAAWNSKLENDLATYESGMGFSRALDDAVEHLNDGKYNEYQKVIFLISETYLDYKRDSSSDVPDEQKSIEQSLNNIPEGWRLYIIQLPCQTVVDAYKKNRRDADIEFWDTTVQSIQSTPTPIQSTYLLHRDKLTTIKSVADALFKENNDPVLQSLLPWEPQTGRHGWGWIDGQKVVLQNGAPAAWQTDGDTSSLNIMAVAVNTNGFQLFADNKPVGNRAYPLSNANTSMLYNYIYSPQQVNDGACKNYGWGFQPETSNQNTVGIFWWQASYPTLELTATVAPSITMNNPHSFSVIATLRGGDNSCYQGQLKINDQIYRNAQGRPELRDIPDLSWYDIPYDPSKIPLQFPVIVEILRRNSIIVSQRPNILMPSPKQSVDINFTPVWQGTSCPTCSISKTMTTTVVSLSFDYASHYHHGVPTPLNPEVYLLTKETRRGQMAGPTDEEDEGCNQGNLGKDNLLPILNNDDYVLENHVPSLYAYKVDMDGDNIGVETGPGPQFQTTITVKIPETWQTFCAYTQLLLQWPNELNKDNWRSILCTLEPGGSCEEHNNRIVHQ